MSFEIEGRLHKKFETEKKTETFQAREFVLEIQDGNYSQYIKFQLVQDRCGLLDPFAEGTDVKVYFDLRGREWNGKYFTNLNAWRVDEKAEAAPAPTTEDPFADASFPPFPGNEKSAGTSDMPTPEDLDDLPF
jgi:hypothetical protein